MEPVNPVNHRKPVNPLEKVNPVNERKPVNPVNPVNLVNPVEPVNPVDLAKPAVLLLFLLSNNYQPLTGDCDAVRLLMSGTLYPVLVGVTRDQ